MSKVNSSAVCWQLKLFMGITAPRNCVNEVKVTNSVAPETEGSSPHSQQPASGPYPEPGESTPHPPPPISLPSKMNAGRKACVLVTNLLDSVHRSSFYNCISETDSVYFIKWEDNIKNPTLLGFWTQALDHISKT
jgi:hypothetical protein